MTTARAGENREKSQTGGGLDGLRTAIPSPTGTGAVGTSSPQKAAIRDCSRNRFFILDGRSMVEVYTSRLRTEFGVFRWAEVLRAFSFDSMDPSRRPSNPEFDTDGRRFFFMIEENESDISVLELLRN